jgi:hypothetical protein
MNGICRNFPQSILEVLRGDDTRGDNKLVTTLFCISSALKKLSQKTELPASGCDVQPARTICQKKTACFQNTSNFVFTFSLH